jgi:hypothetical protein
MMREGRWVTKRACSSVVQKSAIAAHASTAGEICALLNGGTGSVRDGTAAAGAISIRAWRRLLLEGGRLIRNSVA